MFVTPSSDTNETVPFPVQPEFQVFDANNNLCENLGLTPWVLTAEILSGGDPNARVLGVTNVTFVNGTAKFNDLSISHAGSAYVIRYFISYPANASHITAAQSGPHNVHERDLDIVFSVFINNTRENTPISPQPNVTVVDKADGSIVETGWKGRSWWFYAELLQNGVSSSEVFGLSNVTIDNGAGAFTNLAVSEVGSGFQFNFFVNTTPPSSYTGFYQTEIFNVSEGEYTLRIAQDIGNCNDTVVCGMQPILEIRHVHPDSPAIGLNDDGTTWSINATLCSEAQQLIGTTLVEVDYATGKANFSDLKLAETATTERLCYTIIVTPANPMYNNIHVTGASFDVNARQFYLAEVTVPAGANQNVAFSTQPTLEIRTVGTGQRADPFTGTWNVTAAIGANPNTGVLSGTTSVSSSGTNITFTDLVISTYGVDYTLTYTSSEGQTVSFLCFTFSLHFF